MLLLVTVLLSFILFTLPDKIRWLIPTQWSHSPEEKRPKRYKLFTALCLVSDAMYPFHVAINPFIYTACDRSFRAKMAAAWGRLGEASWGRLGMQGDWVRCGGCLSGVLHRVLRCLYGFKLRRYEVTHTVAHPVTISTRVRSSTKVTRLQESPTVTPTVTPTARRSESATTGL